MKKKLILLLALVMTMSFTFMAACGSDDAPEADTDEAEEVVDAEEPGDAPDIGTEYGYMGHDPVELAVWEYLADDVADSYAPEDDDGIIDVPVVKIIKKEEGSDGDYYFYGDYWVFRYKVEGDTLVCVSGGNHPGKLHVVKDDDGEYEVADTEMVKDGGEFEPSAKEIFGDDYDKFMDANMDTDETEELRAQGLADYVKTNGLAVTKYQDPEWDPVDLPL